MATAKTTSTAKKTTAKKPSTPKPKPVITVAEPEELGVDPFITEEPKKKPVQKKDEVEYVDVFIPLDPHLADIDGQYMIGSDNGRFFKYKRGASHHLEAGHAEYILSRIKGAQQLEAFIEEKRYKV